MKAGIRIWRYRGALLLLLLGAVSNGFCADESAAVNFRIDVRSHAGTIRPLQGLDNGPLCARGAVDLSRYYRALGVGYVRLHDVPWSYDDALDINYVFPNWHGATADPGSYDFQLSDYYLRDIVKLKSTVIYRLGYSAEFATPNRHSAPPDSFQRFAAISAHIVAHYDKGWANGHAWGIRYWEIWNEPDNSNFWTGTPAAYDQLYAVTARKLKAIDPQVMVGGPGLAAQLGFLEQFLQYCSAHHVPLDFVSWHIYARDPQAVLQRARAIRSMVVKYGYAKAKIILDEWNYGPSSWDGLFVDPATTDAYFSSIQSSVGAAYDAAVLMQLQDAPVDIATFYAGTTELWGMFSPWGVPQKPYFAFLAFRKLLGSPERLVIDRTRTADGGVFALAGASRHGDAIRILISNRSTVARKVRFELDGLAPGAAWLWGAEVVDATHDLQPVSARRHLVGNKIDAEVGANSVVLLTITNHT